MFVNLCISPNKWLKYCAWLCMLISNIYLLIINPARLKHQLKIVFWPVP